jgi:putative endonuclease
VWYLYVVRTVDGTLYAGISTDVRRRFGEHMAQGRLTARYLRSHKPRELVLYRKIGSQSLALKVEYHFKRLPKRRKEHVVRSGRLVFDADTGRMGRKPENSAM